VAGDPAWLTIDSEGERRHVRLDLQLTTIGRNEANVVDLHDKRLSRFHCELRRRGEEYLVHDCGSRNGTKLNGCASAPTPSSRTATRSRSAARRSTSA